MRPRASRRAHRLAAYPWCSADQGGEPGRRIRCPVSMTTLAVCSLVAAVITTSAAPFVEASHCGSRGCDWVITVSQDGVVTVDRPMAPHQSRRYRLSTDDFRSFRMALERERPTELTGNIGDLVIDGPVREVRVSVGGRSGTFRLYSTPPGLGWTYRTDPSDVSRAIRLCEAVRALGGSGFAGCVDVR